MAGANLKLLSPKAIVKYVSFFVESFPAIYLNALELNGVRSYYNNLQQDFQSRRVSIALM